MAEFPANFRTWSRERMEPSGLAPLCVRQQGHSIGPRKILNYYAAKRIRNPDNAGNRTGVHVRVYVELVSKGAGGVPKTAVTSNYPVGTTWPTWYPCSLRTVRKHPYVGLLIASNAPRINSLLK